MRTHKGIILIYKFLKVTYFTYIHYIYILYAFIYYMKYSHIMFLFENIYNEYNSLIWWFSLCKAYKRIYMHHNIHHNCSELLVAFCRCKAILLNGLCKGQTEKNLFSSSLSEDNESYSDLISIVFVDVKDYEYTLQ